MYAGTLESVDCADSEHVEHGWEYDRQHSARRRPLYNGQEKREKILSIVGTIKMERDVPIGVCTTITDSIRARNVETMAASWLFPNGTATNMAQLASDNPHRTLMSSSNQKFVCGHVLKCEITLRITQDGKYVSEKKTWIDLRIFVG